MRRHGRKLAPIVVVHQAVGVEPPFEALDHSGQHGEKRQAVGVIPEDIFLCVAAGGEMVERAGYSMRSGRTMR